MTRQTKAQAASQRREIRQGIRRRMAFPRSRVITKAKRTNVGGPKPVVPNSEALVELDVVDVVSVKVVVTVAAPGAVFPCSGEPS